MSGRLDIIGIGPGDEALITPDVRAVLDQATDAVGYIPYVERVAGPGLRLHPSDNRVELDRARHALQMALQGQSVAVVSSGDPGVFAMASAVFEAMENWPEAQGLEVAVHPGITAMLAAAAALGAPLGHDFCCINLSDNLKPWALIEKRLRLAVEADFAMAFYNPRSVSRPEGFAKTLEVLSASGCDKRLISFARNVSRPDQTLLTLPLSEARPEMADMRTLVILGNSATRRVGPWIYSPRSA